MSDYEKWLWSEGAWIDRYLKKTKRMLLFFVFPVVLIFLFVFFGVMNMSEETPFIRGALAGLYLGIFICVVFSFIMFPLLSKKRYVRKVKRAVKRYGLGDMQKEELGREMLEAESNPAKFMEYELTTAGKKKTPVRFAVSEHYCILEGMSPYFQLVALRYIASLDVSKERTLYTNFGSQINTVELINMHVLQFYRKDRAERGFTDEDLPDEAFVFLSEELRDRAYDMLQNRFPTPLKSVYVNEDFVPKNDVEKWLTYTYAIWMSANQLNFRYIGGVASEQEAGEQEIRTLLERDWGIYGAEDLKAMHERLLADAKAGLADKALGKILMQEGGWNLCRAVQLAATCYVVGYISREEMLSLSIEAGKLMQHYYKSWEELFDSYLNGFAEWRSSDPDSDLEPEAVGYAIEERGRIAEQLLGMKEDGPAGLKFALRLE